MQTIQGDAEKSAANNSYVDLLSLTVNPNGPSTLRISYHSLVWKTNGSGRIPLGIRLNGAANTIPSNRVQIGAPSSAQGWATDSLYLADTTYFVDVPAGTHTLTLVVGSWDGGTAHAKSYGMNVEMLKQGSADQLFPLIGPCLPPPIMSKGFLRKSKIVVFSPLLLEGQSAS